MLYLDPTPPHQACAHYAFKIHKDYTYIFVIKSALKRGKVPNYN